jgi:FMN-dependent NADH-azoreductase
MRIMHVDASAKRERSNSRALSRYFLERLRTERVDLEVDYLDVTVDTPPQVTEAFAIATYTPAQERTAAMKATLASSDALCERLLAADALVFAMPMYNWSMPSAFKAFIDSVTRTGLTYVNSDDGRVVGQLVRQKVLFITSRGADLRTGSPYESMDALTPALKAAFGFLGVAQGRLSSTRNRCSLRIPRRAPKRSNGRARNWPRWRQVGRVARSRLRFPLTLTPSIRTMKPSRFARSDEMNIRTLIAAATLAGLSIIGASQRAFAADATAARETITPAFAEAIANVPGKTMTALVVDYAPGGKSPSHRHGQAFVVGYVLSGAIRSRVNDGEERVYHAGEYWTEKPGVHHTVSENASAAEPAKLLAIFVADTKDRNLVTFDKK